MTKLESRKSHLPKNDLDGVYNWQPDNEIGVLKG